MPGTIILKPLEAKITSEDSKKSGADSYCVATVGEFQVKSSISKNGGKFPYWEDALTVRTGDEPVCFFEVKDKDIDADDLIGATEIDLIEVAERGRMTKWYDLQNEDKTTGQILLEIAYSAGEYPPDSVLYAESRKLSGEDFHHTPRSSEKGKSHGSISNLDEPIPEVDEEAK